MNENLQKSLDSLEKLGLWFLYAKYCVPSKDVFFWSPYIQALPDAEDLNHVLFMTDEEVDILKGSFAHSTAVELRARAKRTFNLLRTELFQDEDVDALAECTTLSENAWNWAMATVLARHQRYIDLKLVESNSKANKQQEDGGEKKQDGATEQTAKPESFPAIVPYFDFIGYYPTASGLYGRTADGLYHAELEHFDEGEVLRGISADCGAMLFVRFGLHLRNSPFPCASLPSSFISTYAPKASRELEARRKDGFNHLEQAGLNNHIFHIFESTITEELLLRSEMVNMALEDYEAINTADDELREELSMKTRLKALRWLGKSVEAYLETNFPTTIEQDEKKLHNPEYLSTLSRRSQIALTVIHEEKNTLQSFINAVESHISASGADEHDEL